MKALIESIHLNIKHDFNQQDLIEIPIVWFEIWSGFRITFKTLQNQARNFY